MYSQITLCVWHLIALRKVKRHKMMYIVKIKTMLIVKEKSRYQLLKRWTALSTITIQLIVQLVSLIFIHWIVI